MGLGGVRGNYFGVQVLITTCALQVYLFGNLKSLDHTNSREWVTLIYTVSTVALGIHGFEPF